MDHRAIGRDQAWLKRGPRPPPVQALPFSPRRRQRKGGQATLHLQQGSTLPGSPRLLGTQGGTGQPLEAPITAPPHADPSAPLLTAANPLREEGMSPPPAALCSGPRAPPADGLSFHHPAAALGTVALRLVEGLGAGNGREDGVGEGRQEGYLCIVGEQKMKVFFQGRVFG